MDQELSPKWTGRPLKTRNKMVSLRVTKEELRELERQAARRQTSVSQLLRAALEQLLGQGQGSN